jgi:hypothetical protein
MSEVVPAFDLTPFHDRYEIVGELRRPDEARTYNARRRDDGATVEIMVVQVAADDPNRSLAHFASDVNLLINEHHPHLVPVLEGRWLGANAFAIVRPRVDGVTLAERLSHGESLEKPRIAEILHDVNGVLQWARAVGVVHRAVYPTTVWFERGADRPVMIFAPAPIPTHGVTDAGDDARTIGALSRAMLLGDSADGTADTLNAIDPPLATRLVDATQELLGYTTGRPVPDVSAYIAVVAMGDVLREGETDMARLNKELTDQHRAIRDRWEADRAEIERIAGEEAARCANELADARQRLADEQARFDEDRLALDQSLAEAEAELIALAKARAIAEQRRFEVTSVPVVPEPPAPRQKRRYVPIAIGVAVILFATLLALAHREGAAVRAAAAILMPDSLRSRLGPPGPVPTQDPDFLTRSANGELVPAVTAPGTPSAAASAPHPVHVIPRRPSSADSARTDTAHRDSTSRRDSTIRRDTSTRVDTLRQIN